MERDNMYIFKGGGGGDYKLQQTNKKIFFFYKRTENPKKTQKPHGPHRSPEQQHRMIKKLELINITFKQKLKITMNKTIMFHNNNNIIIS